ncbi:unnamed protein product [Cladocopium goreaui]|uniref:Uncharacterized protein n=1 Tax=Cladocopium goreaui TaxID=2562237 RepID=A0A9P1BS20_9DINO|nr:unnamed protein product [Cladocopium goreaui]
MRGTIERLVFLLESSSGEVQAPACRALERIACASKTGMQALLVCEPLAALKELMESDEPALQLESTVLVANTIAFGGPHVEEVLKAGSMDETPSSAGGSPKSQARKKERRLPTWGQLESRKVNAACAMDRVEFLASTRNRFTEFRASEANEMRQAIRSRSTPSMYMRRTLSSSAEGAAEVLTKQNTTLTTAKTNVLRLEALNKFIVEKEKHTGGKKQEQAALSFARKSQPIVKPYPMYDELYNLPLRDPDRPREFPVSAATWRFC